MTGIIRTVKDTFLGGAEKKGAKASIKGIEAGQEFIRQGTEQARRDIQNIFPGAQQALSGGFQGALDIFGQAIPQQANIFQQGNVAAQQQIAQGLPQFQNAILGRPIDFGQFQPTQLQQPDFSFLSNVQLPQLQNPFAPPEQIGPQPQNNFGGFSAPIASPLGGRFNNRRIP